MHTQMTYNWWTLMMSLLNLTECYFETVITLLLFVSKTKNNHFFYSCVFLAPFSYFAVFIIYLCAHTLSGP